MEYKLLIDKYVYETCTNFTPQTIKTKKAILNSFGKFNAYNIPLKKDDVLRYFNSEKFKTMADTSQNRYKAELRIFFNWYGIDIKDIAKQKKGIKTEIRKSDLLTRKEIRTILKHLSRPIDKAIFMLLLETGARKSEIINLKIGDITFYDSYGLVYIRESKTAQRSLPIIESIPYLMRYFEDHPLRDDPYAYFFVHKWNGKFKKYSITAFNRLLNRNTKFMDKNIFPHLLRHSTLTKMAKHLSDALFKKMAGWTLDSKQASRYVHLSNEDLENKILELHNIKPPGKEEKITNIDLIKCPRCDYQNSDLDRYCSRCGSALNIKIVLEQRDDLKPILDISPEALEHYAKHINELEKKIDSIKQKLAE